MTTTDITITNVIPSVIFTIFITIERLFGSFGS